jgi:DNA topoisomerase-3
MTGEWEFKLKQMESGGMPRPQFMDEIRRFTEEIVDKAKNFSGEAVEGQFVDLDAKCPKCGETGFKESYKAYECKSCAHLIWKNMAGRELEREEVKGLVENGRIGPLEGFRSKLGRPFSAVVKLDPEFKQTFDFGDSLESAQALDFSALPVIGPCPACKAGNIHDTGNAFQCSNVGKCKLRMGKTICQREIPREQVIKILETGKTDLIPRFISKKGKPFSAFLKLEGERIVFEFEPRKPAAAKKGGAKAKVTPAAA